MGNRIRLLHVDDESDSREITAERLERADDRIDVTPVATPESAFELLEEEQVDCVLSDYRLSGMDGLEFLSQVRDRWPDLPFILYTGRGSEEVASEAVAEGATDYVQKNNSTAHCRNLAQRIIAATEQHRASEYERIADLVREIQSHLVRARTYEAVETSVCERLADVDPYIFAWIGTVDTARDSVEPQASAGQEADYLETIEITTDHSTTGMGPTGKAARTRSIQVVQDISEDSTYSPWREDAVDRGYRSSAAIPIEYDGTLYGVLNVYADYPGAFDPDERALLDDLSEAIAHAYHRIQTQEQYEAQYQKLFENAPVMMAFTREKDGEPVIEDCNRQFADKLGYSREKLQDMRLAELYSDESAHRLLEKGGYSRALDGEFQPREREFVTADGERLVTLLQATPRRDDDGKTIGTHAMYVDITDRKRAQSVLEQAEAMETSIDGIAILDEEGKYVYANQAHADAYGYDDPEKLVGNSWHMLYEEEEIERFEEVVTPTLQETGEWRGEATGLRADGTTFPQEVSLTHLGDGSLVCVVRDMTERKKRERELRQFREAVEQTAHAVYITDTDGTIEYINQTFEELTGYSESEVLGQTPQVLSSGEHDDAFYEQFWETINAGQRWEDEMIDERADGEQIVIHQTVSPITDDDGEPKKFVAVARDITKRKEYQDAIERAREELRQIIDLVPDLIFVKNHDGEYLLANEATAEAYGSTPEKVEGKQESEVIPDVEDSEQFRQDDIRVIESGEPREIPEEKLTTAGGETRIFQTTKIPYEVSEADEPAVLGYSRDVTALKEYERQLEEQRDNLQVLNQVVRHDIRNDLQLVLAYGETLEAYVQEDGEEYVEQVIEAARDAVDITMTARDVTKVMLNSDVDQRPVPLRSTLENEIEDIQSSHENALVRLHGSIPSVDLHADDMLESVFRNLLNNAIQHNDKEVPEVTVSATYENETVRVQIADNGPGIPDDRKEKIFEQAEMGLSSEGTGLGLYLVDTLVNRYGGDVRVEDNDPSGSVFVVRFPLAKE